MRILHLNGRYFAAGGAETYLNLLAEAQRSAGHEVRLLFATDPSTNPPLGEHIRFVAPSFGVRSGLRHKRAFLRLVKEMRPDVVHCHVVQYSVSPLVLAALAQAYATVYSVHDTLAFCLKEPVGDPKAPLARVLPSGEPCCSPVGGACLRHGCHRQLLASRGLMGGIKRFGEVSWRLRALRRLGRFIVNSRFTHEELVRNGFSPDRIDVIGPGLAIPDAWKGEWVRTTSAEPTILYVGHLAPVKGVFVLLEALEKIRHLAWKAEFVGDGPARAGMEKKVSALNLAERIAFRGPVEHEHLGKFYRDADLLVFPSLAPESWGFVGPEAMYFGLPVVGFGVGATAEWLANGESGILARAGDADGLAGAMATLLGDPGLRQRLGEEARKRAPKFLGSQATFAQCIERVYLQAMADRGRAHADRH